MLSGTGGREELRVLGSKIISPCLVLLDDEPFERHLSVKYRDCEVHQLVWVMPLGREASKELREERTLGTGRSHDEVSWSNCKNSQEVDEHMWTMEGRRGSL